MSVHFKCLYINYIYVLYSLPAPATTSLTDMRHSAASRGEGNSDVTICINDVTLDSADDYAATSGNTGVNGSGGQCTLSVGGVDTDSDCDEMSIEYQKRQRRRSSWCPEEGRKVEEKKEQKRMLAVSGRRYITLYTRSKSTSLFQ